ncbi:MAG: NYN domain-containing protein [Eubacteriales bacterium]
MAHTERRFAVLIDADNVSPKFLKYILDEVSDQGIATYKRIYGDWTDGTKRGWKDALLEWSVNPIQQYGYTTGKNATDSAMIIDAMDILYSENVDGFCIVSSDSDFTKLAQRLRESGMFVMGMGESKTPSPFRKACDVFRILDIIAQVDENMGHKSTGTQNDIKSEVTSKEDIQKSIEKMMTENSNRDRATGMAELGNMLNKKYSDFDVRNYGYSKLSTFLEGFPEFEVLKKGNNFYIHNKKKEIPKKEVEEFLVNMLEKNDGKIDNMSIVSGRLYKEYPGFDVKQYGFSRFSSFVRSFNRFKVDDNSIQLKS